MNDLQFWQNLMYLFKVEEVSDKTVYCSGPNGLITPVRAFFYA